MAGRVRETHEPPYHAHHQTLIEVVIALHRHAVEPYPTRGDGSHEVFVVEPAERSEESRQHDEEDPAVVAEINALLLTTAAEKEEADDGQQNTDPLVEVQMLTEEEHRTQEDHHRTRGIDRADDGERQPFHAVIATEPRGEDDKGFEEHIFLHRPASGRSIEEGGFRESSKGSAENNRQEDERTEQGVEEQYRHDGKVLQRTFLEDVIETQQGGGSKSKN